MCWGEAGSDEWWKGEVTDIDLSPRIYLYSCFYIAFNWCLYKMYLHFPRHRVDQRGHCRLVGKNGWWRGSQRTHAKRGYMAACLGKMSLVSQIPNRFFVLVLLKMFKNTAIAVFFGRCQGLSWISIHLKLAVFAQEVDSTLVASDENKVYAFADEEYDKVGGEKVGVIPPYHFRQSDWYTTAVMWLLKFRGD